MVRRWPPALAGHLVATAPELSVLGDPHDWERCLLCDREFPYEGSVPILCAGCGDQPIAAT